jgi:branched-chain amino acid transport system ATP-binding protein
MDSVLDVNNLGISFGGLQALDDFNVQVYNNEIVGLIGPNGAGKTTVFNLLTNVYTPSKGSIKIDNKDTKGKSTHGVTKAGIARTFQNIRLFNELSVIDNVKIALHNGMNYTLFESVFRLPRYWKQEKQATEKAMELLSVLDLQD